MRRRQLVRVVFRKSRSQFVLRWRDQVTGVDREEVIAGCTRRRDAERAAADKEVEVAAQVPQPEQYSWFTFCARVEAEKFALQSPKHLARWRTVVHSLENANTGGEILSVFEVDGSRISRWLGKMQAAKLSKMTMASYLATLMAGLRWAETIWPEFTAPRVPRVRLPKRKLMRGRPLTTEEFERMLAVTAAVVGKKYRNGWRFFLRGLYRSGMRLGEGLVLSWDDQETIHIRNIDAKHPEMIFWAETEKGKEDRAYPLTPDFAKLLRRVPPDKRTGKVFRPRTRRGPVYRVDTASKIIARIGRRANVVVDKQQGKPIYATAHDLRRSFGTRWAPRLREIDLMTLMRHESSSTVRKYYLSQDSQSLSERLRRRESDQTGDKAKKTGRHKKRNFP